MAFTRTNRRTSQSPYSKKSRSQSRSYDERADGSAKSAKTERIAPFTRSSSRITSKTSGFAATGRSSKSFADDKPRAKRTYGAAASQRTADSFAKDGKKSFKDTKRQSSNFADDKPRAKRTYGAAASQRTADSFAKDGKKSFKDTKRQSSNFADDKPRAKRTYGAAASQRTADSFAKEGKKSFKDTKRQSSNFADDTPRVKRTYGAAASQRTADSFAKDGKKSFKDTKRQSSNFADDKPRVKSRLNTERTPSLNTNRSQRLTDKKQYGGAGEERPRRNHESSTGQTSYKTSSGNRIKKQTNSIQKTRSDYASTVEVSEKKRASKSQSVKANKTSSRLPGTRINKYLADSGVASRRAVEELIVNGEVKVNRKIVTDLAARIMPGDFVTVKGEPVTDVRRMVYILLNKPKDVITTADDEFGRKTVLDLIKTDKRLFPVGRLDRNTTGVLLLTNDGELAHRLTHPSYQISRVYNVTLNADIDHIHAKQISRGVTLDDGEETQPCEVFVDPLDGKKLIIELREGKNREVRRIFEKFGYDVRKLDRKFFATLSTRGLARGKYRVLTRRELSELRQLTGLDE